MKNIYFFTFSFIFIFISFLNSTIINIPADQPTIQQGINVSIDCDTVLVQPGTYFENINYNGKNITVASLFLTTQDTTYISQTIIDGDQNGSVVTFESGEDSSAVLIGFTITNGSADHGCGIYCFESNPSLKYAAIIGNISNSYGVRGGGIYCSESNLTIERIKINENFAYFGGGLYLSNSNLNIINSDIMMNTAQSYSGGINCTQSILNINNVTFTGNSAFQGAGIFCRFDSEIELVNVFFIDNSAENIGGGINCKNSSLIIINSLFSGNYGFGLGGGICLQEEAILNLENVTINNNNSLYGGGIYCSESVMNFSEVNKCNIYSNNNLNRGFGADIYLNNCETVSVIVDTFTVLTPTDFYAPPIDNYYFDIEHSIIDSLINSNLFVSVNGSNSNSGICIDDPLKTINYALARIYSDAQNQNTIYLAPGIYSPETNGEGFPIMWSSYVSLEGSHIEETILDANNESSVLEFEFVTETYIRNITVTGGYRYVGGGLRCAYSNPVFENILIKNNSSSLGGGAMFCKSSDPILRNLTIVDNDADDHGGGIYCLNNCNPNLINCIMWNNAYEEIYFSGNDANNSITIEYSDIEGGENGIETNENGTVYWLDGNIDQEPLFIGTGEHPHALTELSPCIDTGTPDTTGMNLPPYDIIGNERIWDGNDDGIAIIDMGAYEYGAPEYVKVEDENIQSSIFNLQLSNYPNPFNPSTTISFQLNTENTENTEINIYNIKGQKIRQYSIFNNQSSICTIHA